MNNRQTKKKFSFSIIDFIIVFVVIALIVGVVVRYDIVGRLFSKTSLENAKITFIAEKISPEEAKAFVDNSVFYTGNEEFGVLLNSASEKSIIYIENETGALISYEDEKLLDINGSFTCKVLKTDNGFLLNGNRFISAGSTYMIKTNGVSVKILVISVEEVN